MPGRAYDVVHHSFKLMMKKRARSQTKRSQGATAVAAAHTNWEEILLSVTEKRAVYGPCLGALAQGAFDDFLGQVGPIWEIGAGLGTLKEWLGEDRTRSLTLSEPEPKVAKRLTEKFPGTNVVQSAAEALGVDNESLAGVLGLCVVDIVPDMGKLAREMARVLKPGGRFVHLLDMTTSLGPLVEDAFAGSLVPVPNVLSDPCEEAFVQDLLLLDARPLRALRKKLKGVGHPFETTFGDYCALYSETRFRASLAARSLRALIGDDTGREVFLKLVLDADRIAAARGWPRLVGTPASSARHLRERMATEFSAAGMNIRFCDIARTWDAAPGEMGHKAPLYRSLAVGHERILEARGPAALLCPDAPQPTKSAPLIEASMLVFVAEKPGPRAST